MADPPNDRTYKNDVLREWTAAATGWRKWIDTLEGDCAGRVVTHALLEQAGVRRGDHVLDVGSGYGEPGLSAAQAVGPQDMSHAWTSRPRCWPSARNEAAVMAWRMSPSLKAT